MEKLVALRFRDLVTEPGGTIYEHKLILDQFGHVWWGWWMKQYEELPREFFRDLSDHTGYEKPVKALLFNSGEASLYSASIVRIAVSPIGEGMGTPEPEISPSYYHRGRCPAWFLLTSIAETDLEQLDAIVYDSFPTYKHPKESLANRLNSKVNSAEQLRDDDVTLWSLRTD